MPTLLEEVEVKLDRIDLANRVPLTRPEKQAQRSSGIHLSGVLRYIAIRSKLVDWVKQVEEEELPLRMALGIAWEEFAVSLYPEIRWQPGEVVDDDIFSSTDGLVFAGRKVSTVEEFKLTWKKPMTGRDLMNYWLWMSQGKGYAYGWKTQVVNWHVLYINGDWKPPSPVYKRYLVEFSQKEIQDNWQMVRDNRDQAIAAGYSESHEVSA